MPRVAAVVVTFNRRAMLERALAAIAGQTVQPQHTFVVNNASTDGTAELLKQWHGPNIRHVELAANIGAAGGYHVGIKAAFDSGAEFIWAMDDDVLPDPDALERLLTGHEDLTARGIVPGFLNSYVVAVTGELLNVPDPDLRYGANGYPEWPQFAHLGMIRIRRATFVSILIPRDTIEECGFPLAEMFIWGEDSEYTMRVTHKKPAYLVAGSRVVHANRSTGLNLLTESSATRIPYYFYHYRNQLHIAGKFAGKKAMLRMIHRFLRDAVRACLKGEFQKAKIILSGTWAGLWFRATSGWLTADWRSSASPPSPTS